MYIDVKPNSVSSCVIQFNGSFEYLHNIDGTFLWEGCLDIYDVKQFDELSFGVEVNYTTWGFRRYVVAVPCITVVSPPPYIFIMLCAYKGNKVDALSEIITDLVNRVANSDIKECLLQLESLNEKMNIKTDDFNQLLSLLDIKFNNMSYSVANDVKRRTKLSTTTVLAYCYFLSVVGIGFQIKRRDDKEQFFSRETIEALLNSLKNKSKEDFPSTCLRKIASILPDLFQFYFKAKFSVLLYIIYTSNVMDESALISLIDQTKNKEPKFSFYEEAEGVEWIQLLMKLNDDTLSNGNFKLLEKIVEHLPNNIHRIFLENVFQRNKGWHDVLEKSIDNLKLKDILAFQTLSCIHELSGVLKVWSNIAFSVLRYQISEEVINATERAIITCLEKIETFSEIDLLLSAMNDSRLFNDKTNCLKLLKTFSTSKCKEVHNSLFSLLDKEIVLSMEASETKELLEEWFFNELQCIKRKFKQIQKKNSDKAKEKCQHGFIVEVYHKFADAMKTAYISKHESIQSTFEEMVFNLLQGCSFKALILVVQHDIEKKGDLLEIQETVSMHIRRLLKNGHVGKKPNLIMQDICGKDKLLVNSR